MRTALTIAGSDSSGGAGIQADLKTFAAFGVYGASAITAVTAQSTKGIEAALALDADLVTAQIEAVAGDFTIDATKIGMLANAAIVEAVAAAIAELDLPLVVVDPVLVSSSGERLLDEDGVRALCAELLPRARVVTPNIPEAEALSGRRIQSMDDAREAARRIHDMGAAAVIITGGHAHSTTHAEPRAPQRRGRRSAVRRARVSRTARAASRVAPHARHRLHVCVGGRRRPGAGSRAAGRGGARAAVRRRRDRARARDRPRPRPARSFLGEIGYRRSG